MSKSAVIYALKDPVTGLVRYIGKATCIRSRLRRHFYDRKRSTPVYRWIAKLVRQGMMPTIEIIETVPANRWEEAEIRHIAAFRKIGPLLNVSDGGSAIPSTVKQLRSNGPRGVACRTKSPVAKRLWALRQALGCDLRWLKTNSPLAYQRILTKLRRRPDVFGGILAWQ